MYELGPANGDDMVATFLRAELHSSRFAPALFDALAHHGANPTLIERPDLTNQAANDTRRAVLQTYRGPHDNGRFLLLPEDIVWRWVGMSLEELRSVRFLNAEDVVDNAGGTRWPAEMLERQDGWEKNADVVRAIVDALRAGVMPQPIIVVGQPPADGLVTFEGHARLTAFLLAARSMPKEVRVLLGTSSRIHEWPLY